MNDGTTTDPDVVGRWADELLGPGSAAHFLLAPSRLVGAAREGDSFSMTLRGDVVVGLGFGPNPPVDARWETHMLGDVSPQRHIDNAQLVDQWDFYSRPITTTESVSPIEVLGDDEFVTSLLRREAPDSSVWPGNPEIVDWFAVRNGPDVASLAAVVRWESGYHVLGSVATVDSSRRRGYAHALIEGIIFELSHRDVGWLGLGVAPTNLSAQRVYARAGFARRTRFSVYRSESASATMSSPAHRHVPER